MRPCPLCGRPTPEFVNEGRSGYIPVLFCSECLITFSPRVAVGDSDDTYDEPKPIWLLFPLDRFMNYGHVPLKTLDRVEVK